VARKIYQRTDETFQAVGTETAIAKQGNWDPSYIYGIKNGDNPDPYPKFRELFQNTAFAGGNARLWLDDLSGILARARGEGIKRDLSASIIEKIDVDAKSVNSILEALRDGILTKAECHEIKAHLARLEQNTAEIQSFIDLQLGRMDENSGPVGILAFTKDKGE
jgi:hypothetical protein